MNMVEKIKRNLPFVGTLILVVIFYAFGDRIFDYREKLNHFKLSDVKLETIGGISHQIPEGMNGYIVFYSKAIHCYSCVREMSGLKKIAETYPEIGYYAVVNGDKNRQAFAETMSHFEIPGDYLVDERGKISNRLGLGEHPFLMIFDSDQKLMVTLPMDVQNPGLILQLHRYIAVM